MKIKTTLLLLFLAVNSFSQTTSHEKKLKEKYNQLLLESPTENLSEVAQKIYNEYTKNFDLITVNSEGKPKQSLIFEKTSSGKAEITLIFEGSLDDSIEGEKIIFFLEENLKKLQIVKVEFQYKCYKGRGHTDWGEANCK